MDLVLAPTPSLRCCCLTNFPHEAMSNSCPPPLLLSPHPVFPHKSGRGARLWAWVLPHCISFCPCNLLLPTVGTTAFSNHQGTLWEGERTFWGWFMEPTAAKLSTSLALAEQGVAPRTSHQTPHARLPALLPIPALPAVESGPERGGNWLTLVPCLSTVTGSRTECGFRDLWTSHNDQWQSILKR